MDDYKIIVEQEHQTVMAHYEVEPKPAEGYQSEAALEKSLIKQLQSQGYEYVHIKDEAGLLQNLRRQLELLNDVVLSDSEWKRLLPMISNEQMSILDKTEMIQGKGYVLNLTLDNGTTKNIKLIDKQNVFNNRLQVINQYEVEDGAHKNRYDVTILVNGLPLVHIELKRRGVAIKEAFNQINRYLRDSFWAGRAMFDYVQIFVISNGTETKYYSNTTRYAKEKEADGGPRKHKTDGNTFEFTSYWTDQENTLLTDLRDFTTTFFAKHTILNILTKYCVFNVDKQLLVMRPYQIAATEKILQRIQTAINNKWQGTIKAGGYIWHTTGSGKTLTSFKTAQLASKMEAVNKVLFVVDRKDLDYQTMKEYDNFEKDCANSNSSARVLLSQLKRDDCHIIITTIQKLSNLMKPKFYDNDEKLREVLQKENIVLIFDECHRSQFGDMRQDIAKRFKKYLMFGFTGTPIFAVNAHKGSKYSTTAQLFGGEPDEQGKPTRPLHTYTIINAIRDKNVLRFHVDYESTMKMKSDVERKQVWGIDKDEALHHPQRISIVTRYIIDHFAEKTKLHKFNSILAVDSVPTAIQYYNEFKKQLAEPGAPDLKIATIFTYSANEPEEDEWGTGEDENPEDAGKMDKLSRDALDAAIKDYALKRPYPATRMQPSVVSRTLRYKMHQNAYGITGIAFRFDAAGDMYMTLETGSAIHNIPFGLDDWRMGSTDRTLLFGGTVYANSMNTTPMTTAGWCTWTTPDELGAYYLSLFNNGCQERFRFSFSPDRDELTVTVVAPQPRRFQGNPAPAPATRDITLTASRIKSTY